MKMAEGVGFEPTVGCPTPVFKTGAFDHSATPPVSGRSARKYGRNPFERKDICRAWTNSSSACRAPPETCRSVGTDATDESANGWVKVFEDTNDDNIRLGTTLGDLPLPEPSSARPSCCAAKAGSPKLASASQLCVVYSPAVDL
jgi:hypothetical protein